MIRSRSTQGCARPGQSGSGQIFAPPRTTTKTRCGSAVDSRALGSIAVILSANVALSRTFDARNRHEIRRARLRLRRLRCAIHVPNALDIWMRRQTLRILLAQPHAERLNHGGSLSEGRKRRRQRCPFDVELVHLEGCAGRAAIWVRLLGPLPEEIGVKDLGRSGVAIGRVTLALTASDASAPSSRRVLSDAHAHSTARHDA